ncbi:MAG: hypothetical protein K2X27_09380 [Candidatus Obscuribacterales bacterium]|nr:hypothetical protein [Candidatus Obscuribacterales bacterium]
MRVNYRLFALISLLSISQQPTPAQNSKPAEAANSTTVTVHRKAPRIQSRNSGGTELKMLERAPEMPGITYPNGKFLYGFNTEVKNGRNIGARFEVPDSGSSVVAYYRSNLKNLGWRVTEEGVKANEVVAHNPQSKATVTITAYTAPGKAGCEVYFSCGIRN